MNNYVITIARGFGTGGKEIASRLAKDLGINCYENRILTLASQLSGYDEEKFAEENEKLKGGLLLRRLLELPRALSPKPQIDTFSSNSRLFDFQEKIIKQLAEMESCIIVGKCADYVLREYDNVISVYIEAPRPYCRERIMKRMNVDEHEADKLISRTDKYRADYYKFYTNGNYWTNPVNYDITLNSEKVGQDNCIRLIKEYLHIKFPEMTAGLEENT